MAGELTDCEWELHDYSEKSAIQESIECEESTWEAERRALGGHRVHAIFPEKALSKCSN